MKLFDYNYTRDSTRDKQEKLFHACCLSLVRYFKQIAKSMRADGSASSGSEENADDFLGCINIPLNVSVQSGRTSKLSLAGQRCRAAVTNPARPQLDWRIQTWLSLEVCLCQWLGLLCLLQEIPVVGYDTWFKLEPRSSASKVQGECHLMLKLFTNQVCVKSSSV